MYEALDHERGHPVALKSLRCLDATALYRFKREFRSLVDLAHPNLITLYELHSHQQSWFFTMELIQGQDALSWVRRPPAAGTPSGRSPTWGLQSALETTRMASAALAAAKDAPEEQNIEEGEGGRSLCPWPMELDEVRLRSVLRQLAVGLCFLHDAGKLHRDIKPSNMMVTEQGRLVLLDFGLVHEVGGGSGPSQEAIVGTPGYMSPEQAAGLPLGPASDWYSVGVFLYCALCGRLPFAGSWVQVLAQQRRGPPPPPSRWVAGLPRDLEALSCQLLALRPEDRPGGREILRRLGHPTTSQGPAPRLQSVTLRGLDLIGRSGPLQALHEALASLRTGQGVTVLLHSAAGLGRSALMRRFIAEIDAVVLSGRCYPQEAVPYRALDGVIDALARHLRRLPRHEAQALLPRDLPALARLFPVLGQVEAVQQAPRPPLEVADQQELRRRGFGALRELLARLGDRRPLVMLIDDIHWGDADSAALLAQLLTSGEAPAMLLIASYCTQEAQASPCLRTLLQALPAPSTDGPVRELVLRPLVPEEAEALARRLLGERMAPERARALAGIIAAESGGQPWVVEELADFYVEAAEADGTPPGLSWLDMMSSRLQRLPVQALRLLDVVSAAGRPLRRSVAAAAVELGAEEPVVLAQLRAGRLLRLTLQGEGESLEPMHKRVADAVLGRLDRSALSAVHLRLARALEAAGADAEALVLHYQAGGDGAAAARHAVRAAEQAEAALAFERAAQLYRIALNSQAEPRDAQRLQLRLAEALRNAGLGPEAARAYLEAAHQASAPEAAELRRRAAEQYLHSGHLSEGLGVLRELLAAVGLKMSERPLWTLLRLLGLRMWLQLRGLGFKPRPADTARLLAVDTCWAAASGLANSDTLCGAYFNALHLLLALRAGEPWRVLRACALEVSYAALAGGEHPSRREQLALQRVRELAGCTTDPAAEAMLPLYGGVAAVLHGRWQEGLAALDRAIEILTTRTSGTAWERDSAQHFALLCLGMLGRLRELRRRLPATLADARQRGDLYVEVTIRTRVGHLLHLAEDRPDQAEREVTQALAAWSAQGFHVQHYFAMVSLAETALYAEAGAGPRALEIVATQWRMLERSHLLRAQSVWGDAATLHGRALVAAAAHPQLLPARQRVLLRRAARIISRLRRERVRWMRARANLLEAALWSLRGGRDRAQALLRSAAEDFAEEGAELYLEATRFRLGQLVGDQQGQDLRIAAESALRTQDVRRPERMVAMLAPGRW